MKTSRSGRADFKLEILAAHVLGEILKGPRVFADETIATLLQTCKMDNIDPAAWLTQTLERIAHQWPSAKLDPLMAMN